MSAKKLALEYIRQWAETHYTYTGDEVLAAYREDGGPAADAGRDSRVNWGQAMNAAEKAGIHKTIGRVKPRSPHSHIASTCLRQSRVFKGEPPSDTVSSKHYVTHLWRMVAEREMTVKEALWCAYTHGVEQS